jgi:hypothetical protein
MENLQILEHDWWMKAAQDGASDDETYDNRPSIQHHYRSPPSSTARPQQQQPDPQTMSTAQLTDWLEQQGYGPHVIRAVKSGGMSGSLLMLVDETNVEHVVAGLEADAHEREEVLRGLLEVGGVLRKMAAKSLKTKRTLTGLASRTS